MCPCSAKMQRAAASTDSAPPSRYSPPQASAGWPCSAVRTNPSLVCNRHAPPAHHHFRRRLAQLCISSLNRLSCACSKVQVTPRRSPVPWQYSLPPEMQGGAFLRRRQHARSPCATNAAHHHLRCRLAVFCSTPRVAPCPLVVKNISHSPWFSTGHHHLRCRLARFCSASLCSAPSAARARSTCGDKAFPLP